MSCQAVQPAAFIFGPATPANSACGKLRRSASMSAAPSVSPEVSPATSAMRKARPLRQRTRLRVDSPMKSTKILSSGWVAARVLKLRDRIGQLHVGAIQHAIGILEIADLLGREAAALQPFGVDRMRHGRRAHRHHVRRYIARHRGIVADERVRAHLGELVGAGIAAHDDPVAELHVARRASRSWP